MSLVSVLTACQPACVAAGPSGLLGEKITNWGSRHTMSLTDFLIRKYRFWHKHESFVCLFIYLFFTACFCQPKFNWGTHQDSLSLATTAWRGLLFCVCTLVFWSHTHGFHLTTCWLQQCKTTSVSVGKLIVLWKILSIYIPSIRRNTHYILYYTIRLHSFHADAELLCIPAASSWCWRSFWCIQVF